MTVSARALLDEVRRHLAQQVRGTTVLLPSRTGDDYRFQAILLEWLDEVDVLADACAGTIESWAIGLAGIDAYNATLSLQPSMNWTGDLLVVERELRQSIANVRNPYLRSRALGWTDIDLANIRSVKKL